MVADLHVGLSGGTSLVDEVTPNRREAAPLRHCGGRWDGDGDRGDEFARLG